jgi:hypothetical protein
MIGRVYLCRMIGSGRWGEPPRRPELADLADGCAWTAIDNPADGGLCLFALLRASAAVHDRLWSRRVPYLTGRWSREEERFRRLAEPLSAAWREKVRAVWRGPLPEARTVGDAVNGLARQLLIAQARGRRIVLPYRLLRWLEGVL